MDQFFDVLPQLVWQEDEPIAWPSSVSLFFAAKLASEHVKVVLTGEGSDELFGGYDRYRWLDREPALGETLRGGSRKGCGVRIRGIGSGTYASAGCGIAAQAGPHRVWPRT